MKRIDEEAVYLRFSENVVALRAGLGVSQEELAFRAHMNRTQIDRLESKHQGLHLPGIVALAGGLEVPIAALFDGLSFEPAMTSRGRFVVASLEHSGERGEPR